MERDYSPGRPPQLTKEQQELLRVELQKPNGYSSFQQIKDYIEETFDVKMSYPAVHALVRYKWNAKLKVSHKSHEKACDAFKINFAKTIKTAISEKASSFETIRIFCEDETRFGLFPVSYRRITLSGIKSLQIPDNVVLVFLPPYSPELNPIERLWQDIKAKLFENVFTSITQMQNKLTNILNKYTETTIASIVNAEYLTKVENGI